MDTPRKDISNEDLTSWFPGKVKPVRVGEYNASQHKNAATLRWWNGEWWSCMYYQGEPDLWKSMYRSTKEASNLQDEIHWRGLSYDPADSEVPNSTSETVPHAKTKDQPEG